MPHMSHKNEVSAMPGTRRQDTRSLPAALQKLDCTKTLRYANSRVGISLGSNELEPRPTNLPIL